jgi:hypothetical protein
MKEAESLADILMDVIDERTAAMPPAPVNVHIPPLQIDPGPLAASMVASGEAYAAVLDKAMAVLSAGVAEAVTRAVKGMKPVDTAGLESAGQAIAKAMLATDVRPRLDALLIATRDNAEATRANTEAVRAMVSAIEAQNDILGRTRSVVYDAAGRITAVSID